MANYRLTNKVKPKSWYYAGITNMEGNRINPSFIAFFPSNNLYGVNDISLSLLKEGCVSVLNNFSPMISIQNTINLEGIYSPEDMSNRLPIKFIVGGTNITIKKGMRQLACVCWNSDKYLLAIGSLGIFPDKSESCTAYLMSTLTTMFNCNINQRIILPESLYFTYQSLAKKINRGKSSKGNKVFYV